jgi:hypothetical protein
VAAAAGKVVTLTGGAHEFVVGDTTLVAGVPSDTLTAAQIKEIEKAAKDSGVEVEVTSAKEAADTSTTEGDG